MAKKTAVEYYDDLTAHVWTSITCTAKQRQAHSLHPWLAAGPVGFVYGVVNSWASRKMRVPSSRAIA